MEFVVAEGFYSTYEALSDRDAAVVDDCIRRLLAEPGSGWARQGRIEGESGGAWIITIISSSIDGTLYWDYVDAEKLILLALVVHKA